MTKQRCGECKNCIDLERVRKVVLKATNPPFSHANDGVVELWNAELERLPCMAPCSSKWVKIRPRQCDLCENVAVWAHPLGGLRCGVCPRPETQEFIVERSCATWGDHEWVKQPNGYNKCTKCCFEKTDAEIAWADSIKK